MRTLAMFGVPATGTQQEGLILVVIERKSRDDLFFHSRSAGGLESALEFLRAHKPDLVLCDIGLPGMSGFEFAQKVRSQEESKDTYLVALTGYGQPRDRDMAKAAGFDRHLVKPLDMKKLEVLGSAGSIRR